MSAFGGKSSQGIVFQLRFIGSRILQSLSPWDTEVREFLLFRGNRESPGRRGSSWCFKIIRWWVPGYPNSYGELQADLVHLVILFFIITSHSLLIMLNVNCIFFSLCHFGGIDSYWNTIYIQKSSQILNHSLMHFTKSTCLIYHFIEQKFIHSTDIWVPTGYNWPCASHNHTSMIIMTSQSLTSWHLYSG